MFRMWGKLMKSNRLLKDTVISVEDAGLNRTRKVYKALEDICYEFDLPKPLWLEANKKEFMTHDKTRFYHDSFIEDINFDFPGKGRNDDDGNQQCSRAERQRDISYFKYFAQ